MEGAELAGQVTTICRGLEQSDQFRRLRYQQALSLYEGRPVSLTDESGSGYYLTSLDAAVAGRPLYPLTRSACDSVKADIAGRQKPKPMFITTGGDWRARRRAKKLDKFVEGQLSQRQGRYASTWELMLDVFHDSAKLGVGIAKVAPDVEHKKVQVERVFPWDVFVDPREARYGSPQNMFHTYPMEIDLAIEAFAETDDDGKAKDPENAAKMAAIEAAERPRYETGRVIDSVVIREAWRLPFSSEKPGKHVICVDGAVLFEEEWTANEFPFVMLWWERDTVGFWGQGIAEAHQSQHIETNESARRLQNRIAICSTKRTYYDPDSVKESHMLEGGMPEILIPVRDMSRLPREEPVAPASSQEFQWVQLNIDRYYAFSGVSQMSASSQKAPGVTAAVAMQTLNDIATVRFMPKARAYEEAFVTLGRLFVHAADTVAEHSGGYLVKWPGKRFLKELDWREVDVEDDLYDIRVAPISMFSRDPAAMLQIAQDLHATGVINRETFLQMTALPDLEGMMDRETAEREYLEELFSRYQDAMDDEELLELGGYEAPEPFITNKPAAMWLAVSTYWEAKRDAAPLFCLDLLQRWIAQLDKLMAPPAPPPQAAAEAPGLLPPGAAMPG